MGLSELRALVTLGTAMYRLRVTPAEEVLVHDLHLSEVEVDAFWSFVKKVCGGWRSRRLGGRGGPALGMFEPGPGDSFCGDVGLRRMRSRRR